MRSYLRQYPVMTWLLLINVFALCLSSSNVFCDEVMEDTITLSRQEAVMILKVLETLAEEYENQGEGEPSMRAGKFSCSPSGCPDEVFACIAFLKEKVCEISSKLDELSEDFSRFESVVISQLDIITSEIDSIGDITINLSLVEQVITSQLDIIESKVDDVNFDVSLGDAIICTKLQVIESQIDGVNENVSSGDAMICTKLVRVESKIDDVNFDVSFGDAAIGTKLLVIESKIDDINLDITLSDEEVLEALSLHDAHVCTKLVRIESKVDDANEGIEDLSDQLADHDENIESRLEVIEDLLGSNDNLLVSLFMELELDISVQTNVICSKLSSVETNLTIQNNNIIADIDTLGTDLTIQHNQLLVALNDSEAAIIDAVVEQSTSTIDAISNLIEDCCSKTQAMETNLTTLIVNGFSDQAVAMNDNQNELLAELSDIENNLNTTILTTANNNQNETNASFSDLFAEMMVINSNLTNCCTQLSGQLNTVQTSILDTLAVKISNLMTQMTIEHNSIISQIAISC